MAAAATAEAGGQASQTPPPPPASSTTQALPLSMKDAVAMALESNLGLKAERLNIDLAAHQIALAKSTFLPQVQGSLIQQQARNVPSDFTQGTSDITSDGLNVGGAISQQLKWYGGSYSVNWNGSRSTTDGVLSSFNPRIGSTLRINFAQPLLRGFKTDSARTSVVTSERERAITDIQLQQRVVTTEAAVRLAYLSLVGAIEGMKVAEQNMDIAQKSLQQSKARVAVGQSPQIDIIQSEAQVASNQEQLIVAEAGIATAEDGLRSLIFDPKRPDYWDVHLIPTDSPLLTPRAISVDESIKTALANRLDLTAQKRAMEITDLNLTLGKNNTLPSVDFNLNYSAQGTAGTQFVYGSGFPPPIVDRTNRTFTSALGDTFGGNYPAWSLGVTVAYPIGRTGAEVAYAQAQIRKHQQEIGIQDLELQIVREVRDAVRQVTNSFQRVQATQTFRTAAEQQLEAEERRFAVGFSTTLDLQIRQSQLATARVAELNAIISYNRALIILERVQKTQ
jgi:outer membrane protein TolC